jgi:hypothetical protein
MNTFRRTILVGLGGSGQLMLTHVKRLLLEKYAKVPPAIRLIAMDTDAAVTVLESRTEEARIKLSHGEFLQLAVEEPDVFLRRNKNVQEWFVDAGPISQIIYGAGGIRQNGRLALFHHILAVDRRLRGILVDLADPILERRMEADGFELLERPIEIYVCGSVAGGTGSGTFLDVGILLRHLAQNAHIHGFFLTDWIYQTKPFTHRVHGNVYAALCELDYLQSVKLDSRKPYTVQYGTEEIEVLRPPYTMFHLIDGRNAVRQNIPDVNDLCEVIARGIFISIGSLGEKVTSVVDNLLNHINAQNPRTWDERPARYSSFGVGCICYPASLLHRLVALDAAIGLCSAAAKEAEGAVSTPGSEIPPATRSEAEQAMKSLGLNRATVGQKLGAVPVPTLNVDQLPQVPGFPGTLNKSVAKEEAKLDQQIQAQLDGPGQAFRAQVEAGLRSLVAAHRDNPAHSAASHQQFLRALRDEIDGLLAPTRDDLAKANAELAEKRAECDAAITGVQASPGGWFSRDKRKAAMNVLGQAARALFQAIQCVRALEAEEDFYKALLAVLGAGSAQAIPSSTDAMRALQEAGRQLRALHKNAADQLAGLQEDPTTVLVGHGAVLFPDAQARSFHDEAASGGPEATYEEFKEKTSVHKPDDYLEIERKGKGELAKAFFDYTQEKVKSLKAVSVIQALERSAESSPDRDSYFEKQFTALFRLSSPMWMVRESLLTGEQRPHFDDILTIGSPDVEGTRRLFGAVIANLRAKFHITTDPAFAATDDLENIWMLDFAAALPLYFQADADTNKKRYEEGMTPPYHIDKRLEMSLPDIFPPHARENVALRLLGIAIVPEVGIVVDRYLREERQGGRGHEFTFSLPEILEQNDGKPLEWDHFLKMYKDVRDNYSEDATDNLLDLLHSALLGRLTAMLVQSADRAALHAGIARHIGKLENKLESRDFSRLVSARLTWRETRNLREFLDLMNILEPRIAAFDTPAIRGFMEQYLKGRDAKGAAREAVRHLGN